MTDKPTILWEQAVVIDDVVREREEVCHDISVLTSEISKSGAISILVNSNLLCDAADVVRAIRDGDVGSYTYRSATTIRTRLLEAVDVAKAYMSVEPEIIKRIREKTNNTKS